MKTSINFLKEIGHTDRVYIRCLSPKNTPMPELEARGMTYTDKSGQVKKSTVKGYIDPETGEFYRRYAKEYKPVTDGWGHLQELNKQGYGVYFVVAHGGERNSDITHGTCLFHESDKLSIEDQQITIDRITQEFGKPTAVVKTKKSLHAYWASSEPIPIDTLPALMRRWHQFSNCDDSSLSDPAQLMRLPGFDHLTWNPETNDFDRVQCQLLQFNEVSYSLADFDRILPALDTNKWAERSREIVESEADAGDMRSLAPYLDGYKENGRDGWDTAKCPSHDGESSDSLHIDRATGGFVCHAGCHPSGIYQRAKSIAVANGHRFEAVSIDSELSQNISESIALKNGKAPNLFGGQLGKLLRESAINFNIPTAILEFVSLPVLGSRIDSRTKLVINPGTDYWVPAVRWCALVGETGTMKSPVIKLLIKAMNRHQHEISEAYKEARHIYDLEHSAWKNNKSKEKGEEPQAPPPMLDLYFSNFTIEAVVDSIQHYPNNGYLLFNDELAQWILSLNMYRGGKGADRQQWLTIWDAGSIKNNRKSSGSIFIPQASISIVGGIQPQTIHNMITGDDSNLDGLWHRISYVCLPDTTTDPFTEISGDLTNELDKVYRALSEQQHQTYFLSIDAKPLWAEWHHEMQSKRMDATQEMLKGVYPKFAGICGRNALILHCTYAAIAGIIPDQLIPASTLETAIAWTKWELSQTLLQYQLLGLTDDPELSRILKFIDKFSAKGWISARDVTHWWSGREKPNTSEIKSFMAKVVSLGHAIDNDEPNDSPKYRIQILGNGSNSSNKNSEPYTQSQESLLLPLVTENTQKNPEPARSIVTNFVTTANNSFSNKTDGAENEAPLDDFQKTVTKTVDDGSNKPETAVNGHRVDLVDNSVTSGSNNTNGLTSNDSSDPVTTVTTISNNSNLKIGDRVELAGEIITIDKIEVDKIGGVFIGGETDDGSYIGGNISLVSPYRLPDNPKPPPVKNQYTKKDVGGGFFQIISEPSHFSHNNTETIDGVEVEYEC